MKHRMDKVFVTVSVFVWALIAVSDCGFLKEKVNLEHEDVQANVTALLPGHGDRTKRGIVSIVFYTGSVLLQLTSAGLTLSTAITGGCSTYPSICSDKRKIEALDAEIKEMKKEYDKIYLENKESFIKFREANTANEYIQFHMNNTMQTIGNLTEIETVLYDKVSAEMPILFQHWLTSRNASSEQYITALLGTLEYSLSDIQKKMEDDKRSAWIGIASQFLVLETLGRFVESYTKSYNQIKSLENENIMESALWAALFTSEPSEAAIILDADHPSHDEVMRKYGAPESITTSMKTKFQTSGKTLKNMFRNAIKYFQGLKRGLRKWTVIRSWKGFKGKLTYSLQKPIRRMKSIAAFITDPTVRKYRVQNFKLDWSERIMRSIGAIADLVSLVLDQVQWASVRDQMRELREDYQEYRDNLANELRNISTERTALANEWVNVTEAFIELVRPLREFVENATEYSDLYTALADTSLILDRSDSLFSLNFDQINRNNIAEKQNSIINYLRDNYDKIINFYAKFQASRILYQEVEEMSADGERVVDILNAVKNILKYHPSSIVKAFGADLQKIDIVCVLAALNQGKEYYDFYVLSMFRPSCKVNSSEFARMEEHVNRQSKLSLLRSVIDVRISSGADTSLEVLLDLIRTTYRVSQDPELQSFGTTLTEMDVLCFIASSYPTKADFDYYDLSPFRPDCDAVSVAAFNELKRKAEQRKSLVLEVKRFVTLCRQYQLCACVSEIARMKGVTADDVIAVLRHEWDEPRYCGAQNCCVDLI